MKRTSGYLYWVFPGMLSVVALGALLSGRDLSQAFNDLAGPAGAGVQHPLIPWAQRLVSLVLLGASAERIFNHVSMHKRMPSVLLTSTFLLYWVCSVAAPAFFGSHPQLAHEYLYPLVFGFACLLTTVPERDKILEASRNALFLFMLVGVALIPVAFSLVMDASYNQGLIPGLPRFGGLAPHPVAMGMFSVTAMLCLWARPFRRRWLQRSAWLLGLGVLFVAQSKTAWIAFMLCTLAMTVVRNGPAALNRMGDPKEASFGVGACLSAIAMAVVLIWALLVADVGSEVAGFFDTAQGAQLVSMTGRDQIWAIAIDEWRSSPLFGYGPGLWNDEFRASINMPHATNAHNQFMDTLARSGGVGAAALVLYALVLLVLSLRYAGATRGLSLALFLALALLSVSEVPLILFGYGTELFAHLLLIITLASAASAPEPAAQARARPFYRTAS